MSSCFSDVTIYFFMAKQLEGMIMNVSQGELGYLQEKPLSSLIRSWYLMNGRRKFNFKVQQVWLLCKHGSTLPLALNSLFIILHSYSVYKKMLWIVAKTLLFLGHPIQFMCLPRRLESLSQEEVVLSCGKSGTSKQGPVPSSSYLNALSCVQALYSFIDLRWWNCFPVLQGKTRKSIKNATKLIRLLFLQFSKPSHNGKSSKHYFDVSISFYLIKLAPKRRG